MKTARLARPLFAMSLIAAMLMAATPQLTKAEGLSLRIPLDCPDGGCIIQNYVDVDPGPGRQDYRCGQASYDGHSGTDFRIPHLTAMATGVSVRAAADGVVTATRDGMADIFLSDADPQEISGRECGNGVVMEHSDGWVTQYCHLKKGSISVRTGDRISAGAIIGQVGLSGRTEFPHLELVVRKGDVPRDPFATVSGSDGHPNCNGNATTLWSTDAVGQLPYTDGTIINANFADAVPTMREVDSRARTLSAVSRETPAVVAYGRAINLNTGDRLRVTLRDGAGDIRAQAQSDPMANARAQQLFAVGIRRPAAGWATPQFSGTIEVVRGGDVHQSRRIAIDVR